MLLLGFVDGRGRAYDLGFRTMRASLLDEEGLIVLEEGEELLAQAAVSASMDVGDGKPVPLLHPTQGELSVVGPRAVFVAATGLPREAPHTRFNVSLALFPSAVEHFFTGRGGREFLQFGRGDIESSGPSGPALVVLLHGPRPGRPSETARFRLRIEPRAAAEEALRALA